jgi:hypothetical protein
MLHICYQCCHVSNWSLGGEQFRQCAGYLACGCAARVCGTNAVGLISQWDSHSVTISVVREWRKPRLNSPTCLVPSRAKWWLVDLKEFSQLAIILLCHLSNSQSKLKKEPSCNSRVSCQMYLFIVRFVKAIKFVGNYFQTLPNDILNLSIMTVI